MKEVVVRLDENALARIEEEVKRKRLSGAANAVGDVFLIRLLESLTNNSKVLMLKLQQNRLIVKNYDTLKYDDNRQA